MSAIKKYLDRYAEEEALHIKMSGKSFRNVVVIPACSEAPEFLDSDIEIADKTLIIVVANAPHDNVARIDNTAEMLVAIEQKYPQVLNRFVDAAATLRDIDGKSGLLLVDRCRAGRTIDPKKGVGLARKIGADIACALIDSGVILSGKIYSTDADVILPHGYFCCDDLCCAAAVFPFVHNAPADCDAGIRLAGEYYDRSLRYYVSGLQWAGSPYAFHTIGSCLVVDCLAYAQVRGFPQRAAGEDFYLLNKLAKVGKVISLDSPFIDIEIRASERVPFGTGPAVKKIAAFDDIAREYLFYNQQIFTLLQMWLESFELCWQEQRLQIKAGNSQIEVVLQEMGADRAVAAALAGTKDKARFCYAMNVWFDAFRTLKFIHHMRDRYYPSVPWATAEREAGFVIEGK